MKIVKTLLYILIITNTYAYSKNHVINANSNILDEIQHLNQASLWALDGGIFQELTTLNLQNNGDFTLLALGSNGEVSSFNITIVNGEDNKNVANSNIIIDNKAPELNFNWDKVIQRDSQVVVGPKSQLNWLIHEPDSTVKVYINDKLSNKTTEPIMITEDISSVVIHALDAFGNQSKTDILFIKDFNGPEVSWKLKPPSIFKNNQWYAGNTAKLKLKTQKSVTYSINNKPITTDVSALDVNNNSYLSAVDSIGNVTSEKIMWIEDKSAPHVIVKTLGETIENPKKLKVKVDQIVHIQTYDEDVGILNSEYYSRNKKWTPLPKNFVFLSKGIYRIKIRSTDNIGNTLKTHIVFKITL